MAKKCTKSNFKHQWIYITHLKTSYIFYCAVEGDEEGIWNPVRLGLEEILGVPLSNPQWE